MNINRRALFFALLASPLAVAATHAAPDGNRNNPVIPDDVSGNTAPRRRRDENHDESHHGREQHSSRHRSRRHRDGDDD